MNSRRFSSPKLNCKMPREQGDARVAIEKKNCSAPAITRSGRRFMNLSFQPKLSASTTNHQQITEITGQLCEKEPSAKLSRWLQVMGRFVGSKNRLREESSFMRDKHIDRKKTADGDVIMHLQGEKVHYLVLKKVGEEEDPSSCDLGGRCGVTRFELPLEPRKGAPLKVRNINKWVLCEDEPRIARWDEQRDGRSHYELVKPVLEPMPVFTTSDLEQGKELGYLHSPVAPELHSSRHSSGDHLKRLWLDSDDALAQQVSVIRKCKSNVVTQLSCKKETEQGVVTTEARVTMATLGDISSLVATLDSRSFILCTHSALLTLLNLATNNDLNKAAIVDSGAIPLLTDLLLSNGVTQIQSNALKLLYNLSLTECNVKILVNTGATSVILSIVKNPRHSEQALALLGNVVTVPIGRKAMMNMEGGLETLVGILEWGANSECQERAVGLLMVMAHHRYGYRQAMVRKRAIPALLELSLLGSAVAQKRAVRILGFLRDDREQGRAMSASVGYFPRKPKQQQFMIHTETSQNMFGDGREAVNLMLKQSLEHNLQQILRRDFVKGERLLSLSFNTGFSGSISLPF